MLVSKFQQIHDFVIWPTLKILGDNFNSESARRLLLGTIAHESKGDFIDQILSSSDRELGPAIGLYQIERATHDDVWDNFLDYKDSLSAKISELIAERPSMHDQLATNIVYATAIARMIYYRAPDALPAPNDDEGLAAYWKKHYNTELGKGTISQFLYSYVAHIKKLNFGDPDE